MSPTNTLTGNLALVTGGKTPLCIDEYQRVPDVLDAIKARLSREGSRPGVAVITGSTRQDALPGMAQALTGRLHTVTIWPLSQGELAASHENLLEALRADPDTVVAQHPTSGTTREDYAARVCARGLPLAELATRLASQTGQLLNISKAAEAIGVERKTAEAHLRLLEDLFLVVRLPGWGKTLRSRVSVRPKVHLVDSGLLVTEFDDGQVLAFEVKANQRATGTDTSGLQQLRDALGACFRAGVVLTTGQRTYPHCDRIHVMPIDRLWQPIDLDTR